MYNALLTLGIKLLALCLVSKLLLRNSGVGRNKPSVSGISIAGNTFLANARKDLFRPTATR